jgi:endonuclease/exonuclease/phosphatase family metal-dependent hydrolase
MFKFITLNCQRAYKPELQAFLKEKLESENYDILILQEVTDQMDSYIDHSSYQYVRVSEEELCIVYRKSLRLLHQGHKTFPCTNSKTPFGILWADFETDTGMLRIASVHLYAGIDFNIRLQQMKVIKEILSKETQIPTIIAGDFNTGFFRESENVAKIVSPEFTWITQDIGPTLNTRYTENAPYLTNRIATLLSFFKIGIKLRTDHVFIDNNTARKYTSTYRVLSDRISDHNAVECILE